MGTRKGFLGTSVLPFAIFIALCRRLRPKLILHECTKNFKWEIFCNEEDEEKSESNNEDNDVAECKRPELRPPALTGSQQSDKDMFPGYKVHHMLTKPLDYGWPVQRGRLKVGLSIFGNESLAIRDLSPLHLARAHTGCRIHDT